MTGAAPPPPSFAFVIDDGGAPLDAAGRKGLLDLAARVDAAVPEDEARQVCEAAGDAPVPPSLAELKQRPRWLRIGAAFFAVAIAGAVVSVWRCRERLRSREALPSPRC